MSSGPATSSASRSAAGEGLRAGWQVRPADAKDVAQVAAAVGRLLSELGATPPPASSMEGSALALIQDPRDGTVLVADAGGELVGVLTASWQTAIHVPGTYALIQDLWVSPSLRGGGIGAALVDAFAGMARDQGVARIEVGLPKPSFTDIAATEAFYVRNGFDVHGTRMRMLLA
jgi:GNAT superfamily N-acetyltransferase